MPIEVDLSEVLHNPGARHPLEVDVPCTPELELDCTAPVTGRVVFTNTGNLLVIQGRVETKLRTECPRCITPVVSRVEAEVDEEFTVEHDQVKGRADDEEGFVDPTLASLWEGGHLLNLTELMRQSIVLSQPPEPLCREDCRGLCPHCGTNLNEETCECEEPSDSPFAALASLLPGDKDRSTEDA